MANDQNEYPLPTNLDDQNKRESIRHLPRFFRTDKNAKFLSGVLDPLLQPGKLTRLNTYIGRKDIPNFSFDDNYENDLTSARQYYQLEPGFVYKDPETNEPTWFADYMDYMNSLAYYGASITNHSKLNSEEAYAWDPKIDWDKFVNFQQYYWLPGGPDPITIYGAQLSSASTFNVTSISEGDDRTDYLFTPNGLTVNPRLTLYRGNTYTFNINAKNKSFCIKTEPVTGNSYFYFYTQGVTAQNVEVGQIKFTVPYEAPDLLYYIDNNDLNSQGMIDIKDNNEDTYIDVEKEIIGKINYTSTSGIEFINGLKICFIGNVTPVEYSKGFWYVEGVGTAIRLINYDDLESTPITTDSTDVPFDLQPFDTVPFENADNFPVGQEYTVINRSSRDRNNWSRNNRWFHINVLNTTAIASQKILEVNQTSRATRPIIEFIPDLKLYNNGWIAKKDIDLIDLTTKDVFSDVEGSLGYYVDSEQVLPGYRVLFTADTDTMVKGKIYTVSTVTVNTTQLKFLSASSTSNGTVTFVFDTLVAPPPINVAYLVEGNINKNYSGLYNAISSTTSSLTLKYTTDPGIFGTGTTTGVYDNIGRRPQLTLIPSEDSDPIEGEVVYIRKGNNYKGTSFYYDGTSWNQSQKKTSLNQAPLFDLYDETGISYSDNTNYVKNTFTGNRIFGYRIGIGTNDATLGFPLYYRNIDNIGDIEFKFDLEDQTWNYILDYNLITVDSYKGYLRKINIDGTFSFYNGWTTANRNIWQKAARVLQVTQSTDIIPIDIFNNSASITDIVLQVYVNNIKRNDISRSNINGVAYIKFEKTLSVGDKVVYKVQSLASKNGRGYYEIPANWQNNPFNQTLGYITLGEIVDHVRTITENNSKFSGDFPGLSNIATLGNISPFGRRFLQHSGLFPLASYLLTDKRNNIVDALQWTATQYTQFKKEFLRISSANSFEGNTSERVDQILLEFSKSKYLDRSAFYFSDMAPCGGYTKRDYVVEDPRLPVFVIDSVFNPMSQTTRSILIYVNDTQLIYDIDYNFNETDAFVNILYPLNVNDVITIKDYASTNGSYIPYTPSKLGLFPSYAPKAYLDDTYLTTVKVIQGHDGSITLAYNDYRDDLILEIEKRIYNTRRVDYDNTIFNNDDIIGGYYRRSISSGYFSRSEINTIMLPDFLKWNSMIGEDYSSNAYYMDETPLTYNYKNSLTPDGSMNLPGFWRGVYKYFYDTDRPHSHPWEMQGFSLKPSWWDKTYGSAPYTSNNKVMWTAIENGIINAPGNRVVDIRYRRTGLSKYIPVDDMGNLLSPLESNLVTDFSLTKATGSFTFGDHAPVETAWRRTSEFPFSVIKVLCVLHGSEYIGKLWDKFTIKRNLAGQIYNSNTGKRFTTADIVFPNTPLGDPNDPNVSRSMSSGLANVIDDYVFSLNSFSLDTYKNIISGLDVKLSHRMGAFTSKEKLDVLLDSRSPTATGSIFLPKDNYQVFYNESAPVSSVVYSGVLIEKMGFDYPTWQSNVRYYAGDIVSFKDISYQNKKTHTSNNDSQLTLDQRFQSDIDNQYWFEKRINEIGWKISGYDKKYGVFRIFPAIEGKSDPSFNVGGISESFIDWASGNYYTKDTIVRVNNSTYYKAIVANTSSNNFSDDSKKWSPLSELPIVGGVRALRRLNFSNTLQTVPYGTILSSVQAVVDFLLGYQEALKYSGFIFDDFNKDLGINLDWMTSAKEFMFWSLQKWNAGSIITLSPSAMLLQFQPKLTASIDDFSASAFEYHILKADGTPFRLNLIDIHREGTGFKAKPNSDDGIYFVRANLIQREHVLLLDNVSDFNDIVYEPPSGYRQGRVKIIGFKTGNWDGGYTTPGFMYDSAIINPWKQFTDYNLGDIVSYKNNTYVAIENIIGSNEFDFVRWKQQSKVIPAGLMPNWDYRIEQFRDFYNLDASIYNNNQKALARHLIGYQDRSYLNNIIIDDVAQYKFYQGFIKEKGTYNSISKLFDALRSSGFGSIDLHEEWAFKVGDYGASDCYTEIEFPLGESQFKHNPQDIVLTDTLQYQKDLSIYNVVSTDLSVKPSNYNSKPFPIKDISNNNYGIFKYEVAGYVRNDDVDHIIYDQASLLNYDITAFRNNDKIWLGYTENNDWDVLEYIKLDLVIKTWTVDFVTNSHIYLYCDTVADVKRGEIISVSSLGIPDGTYIVQSVADNIITVYTFNTLATIPDLVTSGVIHRLQSVRYKDLKSVSNKTYNRFNIAGEKIWIDSDLSGNWLVLENVDAFSESEIVPYTNVVDQKNGYDIKISGNDLFMIVSAPFNGSGSVIVYNRPNSASKWAYKQTLKIPRDFLDSTNNEGFGTSIDLTYDGQTIIVSAPNTSSLYSFYTGVYDTNADYSEGDIVKYNNGTIDLLYKAITDITGSSEPFDNTQWELITIAEGDPAGYSSELTAQGVVFVYSYDNTYTSKHQITGVIGSFDPIENEKFGSKIKLTSNSTGDLILYVSSKDYSYDTFTLTTTDFTENSNILTFDDTSNILVGQEIFGIIDLANGLGVIVKVIDIDNNGTDITVDEYVTVDTGVVLTFSLYSIGRVQILRRSDAGWLVNYPQPFLDFSNKSSSIPESAFKIISGSQYGYDIDCLSDNSIVAVSAPFLDAGNVYLFYPATASVSGLDNNYNTFYLYNAINLETIANGDIVNKLGGYISLGDGFGYRIAINSNSMFISAPNNNQLGTHVGAVYIFNQDSELEITLKQTLIPPSINMNSYERFGTSLTINPKGNILTIGAASGPQILDTTFDTYTSGSYASYSFVLLSVSQIVGIGPYYVTFNVTPQLTPPAINVLYTVSGSNVSAYNGDYIANSSTISTLTLIFESNPGDFLSATNTSAVATNQDLKYILDPNSTEITSTTFDNNSTKFFDQVSYTGAAYVYNRFDDHFIYADRLRPSEDLVSQDNFGYSIHASNDCILVGTPNRRFSGNNYGTVFVFNYTLPSWKTLRQATPLVDISKFKKSFYYDTTTNTMLGNLDLYDPAKGKIPSVVEQSLNYQTYYDPAVYEFNSDTSLAFNTSQRWTDNHIGELWWDLSTIKYTWYEQGDTTYRNLQWGQLFPGSVVNVYEWIESKYLPSKYVTLADTTAGLAEGISGIPKDTSDLTYSTRVKYDKVSGIMTTLYYFWVSNKRLIPNSSNRKLSAYALANLLFDPKSQGYINVSITDQNSLSLTNIRPRLSGSNVSINLQFYEIENTDLLVHREYALIAKDDLFALIPNSLEKKWFDSLIGLDIAGHTIPASNLSLRQRYGNYSSPRQSWFVNKTEALKQTIEYINSVLIKKSIADEINLRNLEKKDLPPSILSGEIDHIVDTVEELKYIGTSNLRTAQMSLIIQDGQVYDFFIDDSGKGYGRNKVYQTDDYGTPILWYGPTVKVVGTGTGAKIETYINSNGEVVDAYIIRRGQNYDTRMGSTGSDIATLANVRDFTALVLSDPDAGGGWSLQTWSFANGADVRTYTALVQDSLTVVSQKYPKQWFRITTQSYDVTRYWSFVDWYESGYSAVSDIKYIVNQTSDLNGLPTKLGDTVKILNIGLGTWLLLLRINMTNDPAFTSDYQVIGKQNGTIQFSNSLYNYAQQHGYDLSYRYDRNLYDSTPTEELRIILESIRDDVLIGSLRIEYINLFFNTIHYILSEQIYTDWFFKTSFVKMNQVVGNLNQAPIFQTDPLADYESYIEEVKPYRTKVREFVSSYQGYDYSYNTVSDFDLPSYFNPDTGEFETTTPYSSYINKYPWANWLENHTYQVTEITVTNPGTGYIARPKVILSAPVENYTSWSAKSSVILESYISFNHNYYLVISEGITGTVPPVHTTGSTTNGTAVLYYVASDAIASAFIATGSLSEIVVDNPGYGYTSAPMITINGGNGMHGFETAQAYAIIGNSKVRSMTVKMKFDRYAKNYYVDKFKYTDVFQTDNQDTFKLTYAPEIEKRKFIVLVNDIEYYGSQYTVLITKELHDTYSALVGNIKFASPVTGTVVITYYKNIGIYSASDRINYAYSPTRGQYGKDLSQLMTGVDYGGVEFTSISFNIAGGWDVLPWDISSWDTIVNENDDYVFSFSNTTIKNGSEPNQFTLPYVPADGDVINVYFKPFGSLKGHRIDSLEYLNNFSLYGNPIYSISGPLVGTTSTSFNQQSYTVKVTADPTFNSFENLTTVLVNIFTTTEQTGSYQYPRPLESWTLDNNSIDDNAIKYNYNTWRLHFSGDQTASFEKDTEYQLAPPPDDYISADSNTDLAFGTEDFTIEFFVKPTAEPSTDWTTILTIAVPNELGTSGKEIRIGQNVDNQGVGVLIPNNDIVGENYGDLYEGFGVLELDVWHHLALTREGTNIYFFINGLLKTTFSGLNIDFQSYLLRIGCGFYPQDGFFKGSISNLRIIKGTALYTVNFIPPNVALTNITNTVLLALNSEIVTQSFVGNGINDTVAVSTIGYLSPGDQLIFRKSTSDGTILPNDQSLLDSLVSGGDMAYSTARGIASDEIVIDGDRFVTPDTNPGPEELVQGHIVDSVNIRVYDSPGDGGPRFIINNYIGDGINYTYPLGSLPPNNESVVLTVGRNIMPYTKINYNNQTIDILNSSGLPNVPVAGSKITTTIIDTSGYDILSRETFVADGEQLEFLTSARFVIQDVSVYVTVDGVDTDVMIKASDESYDAYNNVVVVLDIPPAVGTVVQIMVFKGLIQKYSKATIENIPVISDKRAYDISNLPRRTLPYSAYVWVIVSSSINGIVKQDFLRAPDYENFVYPEQIILDGLRYSSHSLSLDLIRVYKNNAILTPIRDYSFDNVNNIVTLSNRVAVSGDEIIVEILQGHDFEISNDSLIINNNYSLVNKDSIQLRVFTNHSMFKIKRVNNEFTFTNGFESVPYDITQYDTLGSAINTSGIFNLPRIVNSNDGVLVSISRQLLVPEIDYVVLDNRKQIKVILPEILNKSDYIEIITTNPSVSKQSVGFKIFKDMLNRTQYKRLNDNKSTVLTRDLNYYDTSIEVADGSVLDTPNRNRNLPGVIEINFERVEYMGKEGNILTQLRRGTLGTGINELVPTGSRILGIGYSETAPYKDTEITNTYIADTAILQNFGIPSDTSTTTYGTLMVAPSHNISSVISINEIDIPILLTASDNDLNRNNIIDSINNYTNITGILASRIIDANHPAPLIEVNGPDLSALPIELDVIDTLITIGSGKYLVKLIIGDQLSPLDIGIDYTVQGSLNTLYNGTYNAISSTENSLTLSYPLNPGDYTSYLNIISLKSILLSGGYLATFNIPYRVIAPSIGLYYTISGNINQNYNGVYTAVSSTSDSITLLYDNDPGQYSSLIDVQTLFSKTGSGPYEVTFTITPQDYEIATGIYYNISGSTNVNYSGTYEAIDSTSNSITFIYDIDPGVFKGGYIRIGSITKISRDPTISRPAPDNILIKIPYLLPIDFIPRVQESTIAQDNIWYRESIPSTYGQNNEMEIFVNGTRLNKTSTTFYDQSIGQDSFEGTADRQKEADYSVDGINPIVRLTDVPAPGSIIKVVTKKGYSFYNANDTGRLSDSSSDFAKFITSTSVSLPK